MFCFSLFPGRLSWLSIYFELLDVGKIRGKVPKSLMPQLPLTVGQSALDIKHCTVCIHLISSFSGEKVSTTLLTNSWASAICSEDRSVLRKNVTPPMAVLSLSFPSLPQALLLPRGFSRSQYTIHRGKNVNFLVT